MINWKDFKTYLFLLVPILFGYLSSFMCTIGKNSGIKVVTRPPSWVFWVVWSILYIILGFVWVILRNDSSSITIIDVMMVINTILLVLWVFVYGCLRNKKNALYIIFIILLMAFQIFGYSWKQNKISGILITPYLVWIIFASMLSYSEVQLNS